MCLILEFINLYWSLHISYNTRVYTSVYTNKSPIKYMSVTEELTLCDGLSTYESLSPQVLEIMTQPECALISIPEN